MELSIIVPSLNRPRQVSECLASIFRMLSVTDLIYELVLVDDGSSPVFQNQYVALADQYGSRLIRTSGLGPSGARNLGAIEAEGEWLYFIDDDVILSEDALKWWRFTDKSSSAGYQGITRVAQRIDWSKANPSASNFEHGFGSGNIIYNRELFLKLGGFDQSYFLKGLGLHFREDTDLGLRFLRAGYEIPLETRMLAYHPPAEEQDPWFLLRDARKYYFEPYFKLRNPEFKEWIGGFFHKGILGTFQLRGLVSMALVMIMPISTLWWHGLIPVILILYLVLGILIFRRLSISKGFLIYAPWLLLLYPWVHGFSYLAGYFFGPNSPRLIRPEAFASQ